MEDMEKIKIYDADSRDIYSIEDINGVKHIHLHGYMYFGDNWVSCEYCWIIIPLKEFIDRYNPVNPDYDYINSLQESAKLYECDFVNDKKAQEYLDNYFGMSVMPFEKFHAPTRLLLSDLTMDTPCGEYIDM